MRESAQLEAADLQPGALVSDTIPDSSHVQNREGTLSEDRESNEDAHDMEENEAPLDKDDGTVLSRLSRVSDKPYSPLQFIVPDYIEWYDENLQPVARRASKARNQFYSPSVHQNRRDSTKYSAILKVPELSVAPGHIRTKEKAHV